MHENQPSTTQSWKWKNLIRIMTNWAASQLQTATHYSPSARKTRKNSIGQIGLLRGRKPVPLRQSPREGKPARQKERKLVRQRERKLRSCRQSLKKRLLRMRKMSLALLKPATGQNWILKPSITSTSKSRLYRQNSRKPKELARSLKQQPLDVMHKFAQGMMAR